MREQRRGKPEREKERQGKRPRLVGVGGGGESC